ncbi:glycosyltransferase family 2 protein [bacterium]|nr:glycosyltransferase family 2 protein [candidate division CSSED10-310 bacterium]
MSVTLFFPAHNERENLEHVIREAVSICPELTQDYEIIIVDDGSTDGTSVLADDLATGHPGVRVIHHRANMGYGGALQSGFKGAEKELVFYTDGDGQFDMSELRTVLPLIDHADVVTCFRVGRQDPWHRKLNTWLFEKAVFLILGLRIKDPDCAFKIYRRNVLDSINMTSNGAMIDVEMLLQAQRQGFRIVQCGVRHLPRHAGTPSGGNIKVILRAMREMARLIAKYGTRFSRQYKGMQSAGQP